MAESQKQSDEWIRDFLLGLREGDRMVINWRDRPLTVLDRWWDDRESGYWRYRFEGYGTEYTTIISPKSDSVPWLRTIGGKRVALENVERPGDQTHIVSSISAEEFLKEAGVDVQ